MCTVEGCDRKVLAKGMCSTHYWRNYHGKPLDKPMQVFKGELDKLGMRGGKHPFYVAWVNMKTRCDNPNSTQYKWYGECGIHYCEEWKEFKNFYVDMWEGWHEGLTLERDRNDEGYGPDNCRWTTPKVRANNRRPWSTSNAD